MQRARTVLIGVLIVVAAGFSRAENAKSKEAESASCSIREGETFSNRFFEVGDKLGATQIYQQNVHGGLSVPCRAGYYSGNWSKSGGIGAPSVAIEKNRLPNREL